MALRAYSPHELKAQNRVDIHHIVPEARYIWAAGAGGVFRYDRKADSWEQVKFGDRNPAWIGLIDGKPLLTVWLDDQRRNRPAIVDRETLQVTPLLLEANKSEPLVNQPFSYCGKQHGKVVLEAEGRFYSLDDDGRRIRPLGVARGTMPPNLDTMVPEEFLGHGLRWDRNDFATSPDGLRLTQACRSGWSGPEL